MFDFSEERKRKYYRKAEELIKAAGIKNIKVDYGAFGVEKNKIAQVYVIPFSRFIVSAAELKALKKIPGYKSVYDRYKRLKIGEPKPIMERGYFEFGLEEGDK